ncbi:WYL domain-containing protein [Aestuariibacter salexigens]|uniref:WYL domain-containing protein n=1 Tax=Aestuariibacter salexigens TaxID=226010 RepID=UPI0004165021|nr:WYL domain-containing protein [Aestuariibacter salexigens]
MSELSGLTHGQRERLAFIDFSLQYFGHIARSDLINRFKTGLAASTRDFTQYRELAPDNMRLVHQTKQYYRSEGFVPLFNHDPSVILTSLSRGFGDGVSHQVQPSSQCIDAVNLIHPEPRIIATLMRAIHNRQPLSCEYVSLTSGLSQREIVPHAIVNNGHRWHVRAYDRKHGAFRDFVCTRFVSATALQRDITSLESQASDSQWHNLLTMTLIPHPDIQQSKAIEMDYGMQDGKRDIAVRAALAAYLLRHWQVDCSPGHKIKGQGCQLALANPDILSQVENPGLAPGVSVGH